MHNARDKFLPFDQLCQRALGRHFDGLDVWLHLFTERQHLDDVLAGTDQLRGKPGLHVINNDRMHHH